MKSILMTLALATTLALAGEAHAHAVHAQSPTGVHPQVVAFTYATGDIPAYVQVEVYGPGENSVEFQNGRTDALGRFAFIPNRPGPWAVVMRDGMGHQLRHEVIVPTSIFSADASEIHASPLSASATGVLGRHATLVKAFMGVSVLCNIFLGIGLWRRRAATKN